MKIQIIQVLKVLFIALIIPVLVTKSSSILSNVVLCSFNNNQITVQSTTKSITCTFQEKNTTVTGVCFDARGNSCVPSEENKNACFIKDADYLTCIGPNEIYCHSQGYSCSVFNSKFYGNSKLLSSNQFDSRDSGRSVASSLSPFNPLFTIIIILSLVLFGFKN
ncbi:hypothetical protein DICPUDRAFT_44385 [Dictyostelium purpureum]|uniref:Uncharacterized protein n=1 Tax=Dictyostelium purpureum TaxID=5786 RepID=F1A649_DICPU|nr:uncharacterized protein DICPUDRAFT_44385 [Dictyostelium purpureum]EGC28332.1 hypothetical protein DICPUDRAFT_44385 [Dictyostelium purpureum]|eukprot:XP_003295144.1 hypothetical protein DICPUDRAFT_44385 [Dictyostelium purpureum]